MGTPKPPKFKPTKSAPKDVKGKGMTPTQVDKALENPRGQAIKDILKENFTAEALSKILSDPKEMQRILPSIFSTLVSIEKLTTPKSNLNIETKNTLLGMPGSGYSGGYGGHPIEGYIQFAPSKNSKDIKNLPTPEDPTLRNDPSKPPRVERASSEKFVKVSQQTEAPELEFLKRYKDGDAIAKKLVAEIFKQNSINQNDQHAFVQIVSKYQKTYTNDLKTFLADTEPGQNILSKISKITPKR